MLSWTTSSILKQLLDCMKETSGDADALIELLSRSEVDINAYDSSGFTLMHHAASLGYDDCIYALFKLGANLEQFTIDNRSTVAVANDFGFSNTADFIKSLMEEQSGFLSAITNNDIGYIKSHIKSPDCKFYRTGSGLLPLHYACQVGVNDIVNELIDGGFDINQKDNYGRTPLHWAALVLDLQLFLLLTQKGADYHIRSLTGKTPITMAIPFLKDYDQPDFSALCDEAFFDAIRRLDMESCEIFIDCRSRDYLLGLTSNDGNTPLHIAVLNTGSTDVNDIILQTSLIRMLLSVGFDVHATNKEGHTVIDVAKLNPHPQILSVIDPSQSYSEVESLQLPSVMRGDYSPLQKDETQGLSVTQLSGVRVDGSQGSSVTQPPSGNINPSQGSSVTQPPTININPSQLPPTTIESLQAPAPTEEHSPLESVITMNDQAEPLSPSSSVASLLLSTGLQEYQSIFEEKGYHKCYELFSLTEKNLVDMNMKFGHRKYLMNSIRKLDIVSTFLEDTDLTSHKEELQEMGFKTVWSILGVQEEHAKQMGLSEEEMQRWLTQQAKIEIPPLPAVDKNDRCEPILHLIFNEEDTQSIVSRAALTSISILFYIDMNSQDELKVRFGEIVGLCYIKRRIEQQLKK